MNGLRTFFSSIFVKFSAAFLLVGLIPLFALSLVSLQTFEGHVQKYTVNNLRQMSVFMSYNLNNMFLKYNEISKFMYTGRYEGYSSSDTMNQLINVNTKEQINTMPINAFLQLIVSNDRYIRSAYFVRSMDRKLYFQTKEAEAFLPDSLPIDEWMAQLRDQPTHLAIVPTHPDFYFFDSSRHVMTFGRNLIDTSGNLARQPKVIGTLFYDVDSSVFDSIFREMNLGPEDELYVLDARSNVYFSNRDIPSKQKQVSDESASDMMVLSESIPFLDGQVVIRISKSDLYEQLTSTRKTVYFAIAICAFILFVMGTWFSRRLASPIRNIIKHMTKVESGHLDAQIAVYGKDEISRLVYGFNRMVERLKAFINEAYVAEIKQKQAELNALKSQIRPHYLYNTLEVIRMNAVSNDDEEVADMILSLSNQLKYVIDYGEEWVSIRKELEHLKDYFYIIRVRFENRFELRLDLSDEVDLDSLILKLSLQPIVENAIQHGIRPKGGKGTVLVAMEIFDDKLAVTVYDDGIGMDEDTLAALEVQLMDSKAPSKNVGMKNVHERIKTVCGEAYGLSVSSRKHIGTSVRMTFPIRKGVTEHGDSSRNGG